MRAWVRVRVRVNPNPNSIYEYSWKPRDFLSQSMRWLLPPAIRLWIIYIIYILQQLELEGGSCVNISKNSPFLRFNERISNICAYSFTFHCRPHRRLYLQHFVLTSWLCLCALCPRNELWRPAMKCEAVRTNIRYSLKRRNGLFLEIFTHEPLSSANCCKM